MEEEEEVEEEKEEVEEEKEEVEEEEEEVGENKGGETSMKATGTCLFGHLNPSGRGLSPALTPDFTRPP